MFRIFLVLAVLFALPAWAEDAPDYFQPLDSKDWPQALERAGIQSCDQLYPLLDKENAHHHTLGIAYETGLCVEQDLYKAVRMYEAVEKNNFLTYYSTARLALIYAYGSEYLRDPERADFFFKQTAIFLNSFPQEEAFGDLLLEIMNEQHAVPKVLMDYMVWYNSMLRRSHDTRKKLALELKEQGFYGTEYLWDEKEEVIPDLKRDLLPDL